MAGFDLDAFELSVHDRIRLIDEIKTADSADDFEDAMLNPRNVPAVYTHISKAVSEGALTHNSIAQKKDLIVTHFIVTESFASDARIARVGNYRIGQLLQAQLISKLWKPTGALSRFFFVSYEFIAKRGPRVAFALDLRTTVYDTFI